MKKVRTFRTRLMAIVMVLTLAVSLAGCGENKSVEESPANQPPADSEGQVVDEVQIPETELEGTYKTDQTPPAGLGTELTFTADGKVTDNTGDGAGTYKIEGDKLTITYQGVRAPYTFSSEGNTITLNYVRYVSMDGSEPEYEPYTPSVDDPYPGLIVGIVPPIPPADYPKFIVNMTELEQYIYQNLLIYAEKGHEKPWWNNIVDDPQLKLDGSLTFGLTDAPFDGGNAILYSGSVRGTGDFTEQYGLVIHYSPAVWISFDNSDSNITLMLTDEGAIFYSISLGRVLTQEEYLTRSVIYTNDEASELWPDDYYTYSH
ncbi:MAG: META domain-containing protein [Clostridiales Family XIII bacterium]|nr:META domain-containing protein [Clostridiales Family XIII bacterium]